MKETKFNVSKDTTQRTYDGIVFDSATEMKYYRDVVLPQVESGKIRHYELQKPYILQPKFEREGKTVKAITYVADFYIEYADGREEVIDIKGCPDSIAKLKRKLFWYTYPDTKYLWICYSKIDGGWVTFETVRERRNKEKLGKKEMKNGKDKQ